MKTKKAKIKSILVLLSALLLTVTSLACSPAQSPEESTPRETVESPVQPTLPPPEEGQSDSTLYTAVPVSTSLHPLFNKDETVRALLRLVYEPLFDRGADGRLKGVLAAGIRTSEDGLTLTLTLDRDRSFHNGQRLTAEDVRASMLAWLDRTVEEDGEGQLSPVSSVTELYRQTSLSNILAVETGPSETLIIRLQEADPYLPALLTFPVVPAADARNREGRGIAGTGSWILSAGTGGGFALIRAESKGQVRRIEAKAFEDISDAARAFDQGDIDLLYMDARETIRFADRSRIRKQIFEDGGYLSLFFKNPDMRDAYLYRSRQMSGYEWMAAPLSSSFYPLMSADPRLAGSTLLEYRVKELPESFQGMQTENADDETGKPESTDLPAFTLLVPEALDHERLIQAIGTVVRQNERRLTVRKVSEDDWQAAVRLGGYDAILLYEEGGDALDPADYLEGLRLFGLCDWTGAGDAGDSAILSDARNLTMTLEGDRTSLSSAAYTGALLRVFGDLPLAGLSLTASMVWYSNAIEGTLTGTWNSPFEGVEDLLIWRR